MGWRGLGRKGVQYGAEGCHHVPDATPAHPCPGACTFQGLAGAGRCQWHARVGRASAPSSSTSGATVVWPRGRSNPTVPTLTGSAILSPLALPRAVARSMGSARAGVAAHGFPAHYQGPDQDHMRVATRGATCYWSPSETSHGGNMCLTHWHRGHGPQVGCEPTTQWHACLQLDSSTVPPDLAITVSCHHSQAEYAAPSRVNARF